MYIHIVASVDVIYTLKGISNLTNETRFLTFFLFS